MCTSDAGPEQSLVLSKLVINITRTSNSYKVHVVGQLWFKTVPEDTTRHQCGRAKSDTLTGMCEMAQNLKLTRKKGRHFYKSEFSIQTIYSCSVHVHVQLLSKVFVDSDFCHSIALILKVISQCTVYMTL